MKWKSFTTGALLALGVMLLLAAAAPTLYTPWTSFRGTNQVVVTTNPTTATLVIGPAAPISTTASNAAKSLMVWTNDFDATAGHHARLLAGTTNSMKVSTNGLQGIILGDVNRAIEQAGWPFDGLTFVNYLDGTSGHEYNASVWGAMDSSGTGADNYLEVDSSDPFIGLIGGVVRTNGSAATRASFQLYNNGGFFHVRDNANENLFGFQSTPQSSAVATILNTNLMRFVYGNVERLALDTNGGLFVTKQHVRDTLSAATNTATFNFITTNLLSGQTYTNFAQRGHVIANVALTNVLAGDVSAMSLIVDQNGDGTWDTTNGPVRLNGVALLAGEQQLAGLLQPGARFSFTNQSAGATPGSATIRAGSCQWSRW